MTSQATANGIQAASSSTRKFQMVDESRILAVEGGQVGSRGERGRGTSRTHGTTFGGAGIATSGDHDLAAVIGGEHAGIDEPIAVLSADQVCRV